MRSARAVGASSSRLLAATRSSWVGPRPRVCAARSRRIRFCTGTSGSWSAPQRPTSAPRTCRRAPVRLGEPSVSRLRALPLRGANLPSLGGRRISTVHRVWNAAVSCRNRGHRVSAMASRVVRVRHEDGVAAATLREGIARIQAELEVTPEFPAEVEAAARDAASSPRLPELDRTDIPFVTIDPESALDLDQALHLERAESGFVVHYAI